MSRGKRLLLIAIMAGLAACRREPAAQRPSDASSGDIGKAVIRVTGHGVDQGGTSICEDFRLTDAQAQEFFSKAVPVSAEQIHDDYEVLPCWVQGTTESDREKTLWKIRAGGTADITAPNGDVTYLACKTCDDIFQ
jgi:hypothetical protein